jgi:hypothetical protein
MGVGRVAVGHCNIAWPRSSGLRFLGTPLEIPQNLCIADLKVVPIQMKHLLFFLLVLLALGVGVGIHSRKLHEVGGSFPAAAAPELDAFRKNIQPDQTNYDDLFRYFLEGFETYRSRNGAMAYYPGLASRHGRKADALEGFSRSAPMWGAWVNSGRARLIHLSNGTVDLVSEFQRGLLAGTDPTSDEYWGDVSDLDQRIVEASDIALSLWLFRDDVWTNLSPKQKTQVASWLRQSEIHRVSDNNWHLFPVFIHAVLKSLGETRDQSDVSGHYDRFRQFYRGDGWFSDGPDQTYDYYNAWAIQYQLYWLQLVDPEWDRQFINTTRHEFLAKYSYLIGPQGLPILGRSICYRMATPAPLVFGQQTDPDEISSSEARRALDATWAYFIQRGALVNGNVSQGYCGPDARILDNYSGPASCLWSLRSLIVAYSLPRNSPFWRASGGLLPVERQSYSVHIPSTGWTITGDQATATIVIHKAAPRVAEAASLTDYDALHRMATALLWRPFRPENNDAKYGRGSYSSSDPFCGCTASTEANR